MSVAACGSGSSVEAPDAIADGVVGVLFVDRNHDGKLGHGEPALPHWKVGVYGTGPIPLKETTTDWQGRFRLADIPGIASNEVSLQFAPHIVAPGKFDEATSQLHLRHSMRIGESAVVPVDDFRVCATMTACDLDLPDLEPILELSDTPSSQYPGTREWYLDTTTKPGRVLLRFASMTSNRGDGLLHVVALEPPSSAKTQPVQQRIYGQNTVYVRTAGNFVYHPEHEHFHLANFETYQLRPVGSPTVVATGMKVSFCLTDNAQVPDLPVTAPPRLTLNLPPMSCGTREQGISPGFTDYYGPKLADQWVDVTDVPTGDYELVLTSDPDNVLVESDETNNVVSIPLHYVNPLK